MPLLNFVDELFEKPFIKVNRIKEFDGDDECGISNIELLKLCGGIPDDSISELKLDITVNAPCIYEVLVECDSHFVLRTIDFNKKVIQNESLTVQFPGNGIGTSLFINQLIAAKKAGFEEFYVNAINGDGYNGYIHWGKIGYTLSRFDDLRFKAFCIDNGLKSFCLWDLLCLDNGMDLWKKSGFSWAGKFSLRDGSENIERLRAYLQKRGIMLPL